MASLRVSMYQDRPQTKSQNGQWIQDLLDTISVRSYLPGRIRFHLGFEGDEVLTDTLRRELQKLESVKLEAYSVRTRNALVSFDQNQVSDTDVVHALFRGVQEFARLHGDCDLEHHHHDNSRFLPEEECHEDHDHSEHAHDDEDCDHDHSATSTDAGIRKELFKLIITGGVLGYFVYRKIKNKPNWFEGNPLLDSASLLTILSGYPILKAGMNTVQNGKKPTDDTLISIAVLATILMGESITGLSVVWLINLGRLLEAITLKRSRTAIKELMDVSPKEAWLKEGKDIFRVPVETITKNQIVRVFEGEKVPLDGKIVSGQGLVKEAFITGESVPHEKKIEDTVYAGSLVEKGEIDIEVTNLVHDTVVARMIDAIENVRDKKAPIEKIGTRFAGQFVPVSLGLAAVTLLWTGDLRRAITMLVIACPCAAGLATPTAVSASIGQAARKGILIKGGTHIEAAAHVDAVIFDKTGTLTLGEPVFQRFMAATSSTSSSEEECLVLAASAEQHTTHPLGIVLVKEARHRGLKLLTVETQKSHPGLGISAKINKQEINIGNLRYMESLKVVVDSDVLKQATKSSIAGESILHLSIGKKYQGTFIVQDSLRTEATVMLAELRTMGIKKIVLASGDQKMAVERVAGQLGIKEFFGEMMPGDKVNLVSRLKKEGYKVAMVGDGINDAQALAESDLSIAMGAGHCDVAIESSDVTLARNDLMLIGETIKISQQTLRTIKQNFVAAVGINAGGLVVSTFGKLSPFSAAIVHNASTIAVVLNSLKLGKQVAGVNPLLALEEVKI